MCPACRYLHSDQNLAPTALSQFLFRTWWEAFVSLCSVTPCLALTQRFQWSPICRHPRYQARSHEVSLLPFSSMILFPHQRLCLRSSVFLCPLVDIVVAAVVRDGRMTDSHSKLQVSCKIFDIVQKNMNVVEINLVVEMRRAVSWKLTVSCKLAESRKSAMTTITIISVTGSYIIYTTQPKTLFCSPHDHKPIHLFCSHRLEVNQENWEHLPTRKSDDA